MSIENLMRPFLRWAGGKRWLASNTAIQVDSGARLVEPFLGGGALFFVRNWERALLSDVNRFLINSYLNLQNRPLELFSLIQAHFDNHSKDHFYSVRARLGYSSVQDAADFVYLNRSCFNGLFRVNLAGRFNVPLGSKVYELRDKVEFEAWSKKLTKASIKLADFEDTIASCGINDFIFADPPYTVNHNSNGFIEYNEKIFSWEDQVRLHDSLLLAARREASFVVTNADHKTVRQLYEDCSIVTVERGSEMAARTSARGKTTEIVITGY